MIGSDFHPVTPFFANDGWPPGQVPVPERLAPLRIERRLEVRIRIGAGGHGFGLTRSRRRRTVSFWVRARRSRSLRPVALAVAVQVRAKGVEADLSPAASRASTMSSCLTPSRTLRSITGMTARSLAAAVLPVRASIRASRSSATASPYFCAKLYHSATSVSHLQTKLAPACTIQCHPGSTSSTINARCRSAAADRVDSLPSLSGQRPFSGRFHVQRKVGLRPLTCGIHHTHPCGWPKLLLYRDFLRMAQVQPVVHRVYGY